MVNRSGSAYERSIEKGRVEMGLWETEAIPLTMPRTGALSTFASYASEVQDPSTEEPRTAPATKPKLSERMKTLLAEYGGIAIGLYFAIFGLVFAGFAVAIAAGFDVEGAGETTGLIGAAWLATKLTQPFRIIGTLALTPLVARLWWKLRGGRPERQPR
jgi:hypothetical protein